MRWSMRIKKELFSKETFQLELAGTVLIPGCILNYFIWICRPELHQIIILLKDKTGVSQPIIGRQWQPMNINGGGNAWNILEITLMPFVSIMFWASFVSGVYPPLQQKEPWDISSPLFHLTGKNWKHIILKVTSCG